MSAPLVTVVIPVHDMGRYLGEALRSVFAQDYRPIEVIVVDDGSTDDSASVAQSFAGVLYVHQENHGVASARNNGIARARGAFVAFLDADDLWSPEKLTVQVRWMDAHPEIGFVAAHFRNFLEPGVERPFWIKEEQLTELQKGGVPNILVRRSVFDTIGMFDPTHRSGSDLDWLVRAKDARIVGDILPQVLLHRRIHASNHSHLWSGGKAMLLKALKASINRQRAQDGANGE